MATSRVKPGRIADSWKGSSLKTTPGGAITAKIRWLHYAGNSLAPLCRKRFGSIAAKIDTGNTLVGYATEAQFKPPLEAISSDYELRDEIIASTVDLADLFERFREQQTVHGGKVTTDDKRKLRDKLNGLSLELDRYLAHDYGIDPKNATAFAAWRASHQPFHWFAEFYGVMREGGFDVVIGNPPWVEFTKISGVYKPHGLQTISCNNLWAFVVERSYQVLNPKGLLGLIVPMSLVCTERMKAIQDLSSNIGRSWVSNYESDSNPGQLFDGVKQNVSILVTRPSAHKKVQTTRLVRFFQPFRSHVFDTLHFCSPGKFERIQFGIPKLGSDDERQLLTKLFSRPALGNEMVRHSKNSLLVHRIAHYHIKCFDFVPYFRSDRDGEKKSEDYKPYAFRESTGRYVAAINSTAFYFYWQVFFDGFKAGKACVENFPFGGIDSSPPCYAQLEQKSISLMADMQKNATRLQARYATSGNVEYDQFSPRKSKALIDEIDQLLAHHYGLTDAELDLVINYDVKFRSSETDEEE